MNNVIRDELITKIRELLLRKYPDYVFKEIHEDQDINFLGERYIRIEFWDLVNQRHVWVGLGVSKMEQLSMDISLTEVLINRIDGELKKFKENCDVS